VIEGRSNKHAHVWLERSITEQITKTRVLIFQETQVSRHKTIDRFRIRMQIYQTADSNRKWDGLEPETEVVGYMLSSVDTYNFAKS
jgi:hypothetical protein